MRSIQNKLNSSDADNCTGAFSREYKATLLLIILINWHCDWLISSLEAGMQQIHKTDKRNFAAGISSSGNSTRRITPIGGTQNSYWRDVKYSKILMGERKGKG
jgi:hypothetical protein